MLARAEVTTGANVLSPWISLQVLTNCEEVFEIADECWHGFQPLFDIEPIRFHIGITQGGSKECPPAPSSRVREHLCSHVADPENFAVSDASKTPSPSSGLRRPRSNTAATFATSCSNRVRCFTSPRAMPSAFTRRALTSTAAELLLCGDSGAGKSTLAYGCARAGCGPTSPTTQAFWWSGADDSFIVGNARQVRFRPSAESLFPELHGHPIHPACGGGQALRRVADCIFDVAEDGVCCQVSHIVFLNRNSGREPGLTPLPREIARAYIFQRGIGIPEAAGLQVEAVEKLLKRGVFELHYTHLDWAIDRLAHLAREGR